MTGKLAVSKSGHDRGRYYAVIGEDGEYVTLADGDIRPLEKPKKKNRKHIQIIQNLPAEVRALLEAERPAGNLEIKRAIRLYSRQEENECQKQM